MTNETNTGAKARPKKNRKLLFQITVFFVPLFILMLLLVSVVLYRSTRNGYLKAQDRLMTERLKLAVSNSFDFIDGDLDPAEIWCFDYWEAHPETLHEPITKEEEEASDNYDQFADWWLPEVLDQMPDVMQRYCAKHHAKNMDFSMETAAKNLLYNDSRSSMSTLFVMDVADPNAGFILGWASKDEPEYSTGDTLEIPLSRHPALKSLLENPSDRIEFETARNFPDNEGSYYIAYQPLFSDGKIRAVMGIFTSWKGFAKAMSGILLRSFMIGIGGLIALLGLLFLILYRKAIAPVKKIEESIQTYITTKNSDAVTRSLDNITARNEFGILSENLSEMVRDMDRYTAENIRMVEEREKTKTELTLAANIQSAILPVDFPAHSDFSLYASMQPAREVGGDFYDFFYLDDDHLGLAIADVSGKGIPAALFMMMCKNMIKNFAKEKHTPAEVLALTNSSILEGNATTMFVTVWFGIYEISTGRVTAASAGHEYPLIRTGQEAFTLFKDKHGFVAGGMEGVKYTDYTFDLDVGGTLFLYTDGAPEATNADDELFGTDRMLEALNREPGASPETLAAHMTDAINAFVGDAPQFDDTTMLVLQRKR